MENKIDPASEVDFMSIVNIAKSLRREQLFVSNEQSNFASSHKLYEKYLCHTQQVAWICARQRQVMHNLILAKPESGLSALCQRIDLLENCYFIDIYHCKFVEYPQIIALIEMLNFLYDKPAIIAYALSLADKNGTSKARIDSTINFVVNGLYRSGIYPKDVEMIIKMLQIQIKIQIAKSDNPRRLLRSGSSTFTRLFQKYYESSFASKIFLKTILFDPVMAVLMDDEMKFEIDANKIISVQNQTENAEMFGEPTSADYMDNLKQYRRTAIDRLHMHVSNFIKSFSDNWCLYPATLRWLYQSMNHFLQRVELSKENIHIIMTDLIFTNFICPAILSPNIHGIIDAPLSDNARFNLIQIGQVIRMLALMEIQPVEDKLHELYAKFDKHCLRNLIDQLDYETFESNYESNSDAYSNNLPSSTIVIATYGELITLVNMIAAVNEQEREISMDEIHKLKQILHKLIHLPEINQETEIIANVLTASHNINKTKPKTKARILKTRSLSSSPSHLTNDISKETSTCQKLKIDEAFLMIPLSWNEEKLVSEEEFLNKVISNSPPAPFCEAVNIKQENITMQVEKDTRQKKISLSHDDGSTGNTSDNLEAVSEAHSNHSVASSLELEEADQNDNDNLSDMISANVSGRGTPSISGRDTPSSQITEGGGEVQHFTTPQMTKILNKTRSDIEDKFCKFEIKKLTEGDETISIISDTWSTDVLASDSEVVEANERNLTTTLIPTTTLMPGDHNYIPITNSFGQMRVTHVESETQSESAWSTDEAIDIDDNNGATRSEVIDSVMVLKNDSSNLSHHCKKLVGIHGCNIKPNYFSQLSDENEQTNSIQSHCQNSTDSNNSSGISENLSKYSKSDANENNINLISLESTHYIRTHIRNDKNCNHSKRIDCNNMKKCDRTNLNLSNPFSGTNGLFSSANNNNLKNSLEIQSPPEYNEEEFAVEHRRLSSEQRNAKFDSRRNGMIDILGNFSNSLPFPQIRNKAISYSLPNSSCVNPFEIRAQILEEPMKIRSTKNSSSRITSKIHNAESLSGVNMISSYVTDEYHQKANNEEKSPCSDGLVSKLSGKITGTIPKSISFDSSADKANRNDSTITKISEASQFTESLKTNASFFTKLKFGFKNRRSTNIKARFSINGQSDNLDVLLKNRIADSEETTEDILAKYRRKTSIPTDINSSLSNCFAVTRVKAEEDANKKLSEKSSHEYPIDSTGIKKKLRSVLSYTDICSQDFKKYRTSSTTPLLMYLRVLQAQSLNNQNLQQLSGISELLRCLQLTDAEFQNILVKDLQNDVLIRKAYIGYLIDCHHTLLSAIDNIESLQEHLQLDSQLLKRQIIMTCVKYFVEKKGQTLQKFHNEFVQLTVSDERKDLLNVFLKTLMDELRSDIVLSCMTERQTIEARICLESLLLQRLYQFVMFPNDDGDISRDQVLFEHINKLSKTITPNHPQLRIPEAYLCEAPWSFAQRQLSFMSAYKTANDKVNCVIKCIKCIISLLSIGSEKVVAADDIIPVLIYVIVKVNPPHLLSTIEYVNCFTGESIYGENQYWWTHFCSAITLIKTMDYSE